MGAGEEEARTWTGVVVPDLEDFSSAIGTVGTVSVPLESCALQRLLVMGR